MFLYILLVCSLGALAFSVPEKEFYEIKKASDYFEDFIQKYEKVYESDDEKEKRFEIFKNNLVNLNRLNERDELTVHGINGFTDMTHEEFAANYTSYNPVGIEIQCVKVNPSSDINGSLTLPDEFDWRNANVVTEVKKQSSCGACWAFASIGAIEGQHAIKTRQLIELSEQELVDCGGHRDCSNEPGYFVSNGILDVASKGGVMSRRDYPYTGLVGTCKEDRSRFAVRVTGCRQLFGENEEAIRTWLYTTGPLAICKSKSSI